MKTVRKSNQENNQEKTLRQTIRKNTQEKTIGKEQ